MLFEAGRFFLFVEIDFFKKQQQENMKGRSSHFDVIISFTFIR